MCFSFLQSLYPSTMLCLNGELWPVGYPTIYFYNIPKIEDMLPCSLLKGVFLPPKRYDCRIKIGENVYFHIFQVCTIRYWPRREWQGYLRAM